MTYEAMAMQEMDVQAALRRIDGRPYPAYRDLENTDFTDAYIGQFDAKKICKNPTLKGENPKTGAPTKESLGCGPS